MSKSLLLRLTQALPIPATIKKSAPSSLRVRLWQSATPYAKWTLMEPDVMDEDLLGMHIRFQSHQLDKASKTEWSATKAAEHAVGKSKLSAALSAWKAKYQHSDDVSWAEGVLARYADWETKREPVQTPTAPVRHMQDGDSIYEVIRSRRSVRFFKADDIEREKIVRILEAGKWAPCSGDRQTWKFIVQRSARRQGLAKSELEFDKQKWRQGPILIYVAIDQRLYLEKYAAAMDAAAAIQNMLLMAHHLGIGACWLYLAERANQDALRQRLGLKEYHVVYSTLMLGYSAEAPETPARKPLDKTAVFIGFDQPDVTSDRQVAATTGAKSR